MVKKFKSLDDSELNISGGGKILDTFEKYGKKAMTVALFAVLFVGGAKAQKKWNVYDKSVNLLKKMVS